MTVTEVLDRYRAHLDYLGIDLLDVNQPGAVDDFPLHIASRSSDLAQVAALINLVANINARGDLGYTPLHYTALEGHWQIAEMLVGHGAKTGEKNEFGETPADVARLCGHSGFLVRLEALLRNPGG
ncbi:ankyrin repeat domain-containing protein [Bacillus sp. NP157]|nr:ankyrin repeat domain-containing protein [Bacillus sp. NP157]